MSVSDTLKKNKEKKVAKKQNRKIKNAFNDNENSMTWDSLRKDLLTVVGSIDHLVKNLPQSLPEAITRDATQGEVDTLTETLTAMLVAISSIKKDAATIAETINTQTGKAKSPTEFSAMLVVYEKLYSVNVMVANLLSTEYFNFSNMLSKLEEKVND